MKLIEKSRYPHWWQDYGRWQVIVEAILTQQTKWENVEKSMQNLYALGIDTPNKLLEFDESAIASAIAPSGFYRQKAARILALIFAIINDFGSFDVFCEAVDRQWLLAQKGLGFESADSILCYGCKRAVMVVDRYTQRLLAALGNEIDDYDEIQAFLMRGIEEDFEAIEGALHIPIELVYAYFHGAIVEFCKKQRKIDISQLQE
jgi:endonuclease-3 related protein